MEKKNAVHIRIQPVVGINVRLVESIVFVFFAVVVASSDDGRTASASLLMGTAGR